LAKDDNGKFSVDLVVTQTSATLTQIAEVSVNLRGDQPEEMAGYGMVHRADGIEIRVLSNNNVFIIWDASKIQGVNENTLCGGTCPDAEEDVQIKTKIENLKKEYGLQHNKVANLLLAQVSSEIEIDELVLRLKQLNKQGARTDKLIAAMDKLINKVKRRRRRRDADDDDNEQSLNRASEENKESKEMTNLAEEVEVSEVDDALEISNRGEFGLSNVAVRSENDTDSSVDDADYDKMDVAIYVVELVKEEKFQNEEIKELLDQQNLTSERIEGMLKDTEKLMKDETTMQAIAHRFIKLLKRNFNKVDACHDNPKNSFDYCLKKYVADAMRK